MGNFLSQRWLISRRHLLRGAGVAVALPWLECMKPLLAKGVASNKPRRSVFIYSPNGVNVLTWQIAAAGRNYQFSEPMQALERHRHNITPFSGLHHPNGIGTAHECDKIWLTGAKIGHASAAFRSSVSCDQLIANLTGQETRIRSLELSNTSGTTRLCWSNDGISLPAEDSPQQVFNRLFADEQGDDEERRKWLVKRQSVLDLVGEQASALRRSVGTQDRLKLDEYLDSVREVEVQTRRQVDWLHIPPPKVPAAAKLRFQQRIQKSEAGDYYRAMYDLMVLALRTDMTRVITFQSGRENNGLSLPEIGIPQTRHELSHHNGDPEQLKRLSRSDAYLIEQLAYFLDQLQAIQEAEESLLDRTMILFGSGMSYGHSHGNANLPTILAGGKGLGLKHGQHIDYNLPIIGKYDLSNAIGHYSLCHKPVDAKARLSNLLLTMAQKMEVRVEQFADSLAPVSEVLA